MGVDSIYGIVRVKMKSIFLKRETYINTVIVRGRVIGLFMSSVSWVRLGSRRSIVEFLFSRYEAESNIDIISQNIATVPTLEED
jgi:hypothetical protein